ncbi:MAG TPA: enoyl-CoA hydratase-related protein [Acidimicrobiales bacterium]|nr:enoyl-CoA hydratase-related protein [Acidimicrobiales bacterium]
MREDAAGGEVVVVRLGRPEALCAVTLDSLTELADDIAQAARPGVRGVVLAGGDRAFCAGADLSLLDTALAGDPRPALDPIMDVLPAIVVGLRDLPVPSVAALEGPAVGVGMSLAMAADMRVAGRSASLIPGYLRVGGSPDGGFSTFAARSLGSARALSTLIRNRRLAADELAGLGLVEDVVDDGAAVDAAVALLATLPPVAPLALRHARRLMETAWALPLEDQLDRERAAITELWGSADYREGVAAFLEKRPPRYTGT